jgi:hypothetical protein
MIFTSTSSGISAKNKVNQFHYRPGHALRFPGGSGAQISRQSAHEGGKVVTLPPSCAAPAAFNPQELFLVLISVRDWANPRARVRPEGLCQWKIPIRDPPAYSAVPQPTGTPRAPLNRNPLLRIISIHLQPRHTVTNCGEQIVALYRCSSVFVFNSVTIFL